MENKEKNIDSGLSSHNSDDLRVKMNFYYIFYTIN